QEVLPPCRAYLPLQVVTEGDCLLYEVRDSPGVEVYVRERREKGLADKGAYAGIIDPDFPPLQGNLRESPERVNEQVLKGRHVRLLAANTYLRASFATRRLFTLITKHSVLL